MKITKVQCRHLIHACRMAIDYEESFIDAYSNVHDGSEKEPVKKGRILIRRWHKLIDQLRTKKSEN
jgi:hypothetical protein